MERKLRRLLEIHQKETLWMSIVSEQFKWRQNMINENGDDGSHNPEYRIAYRGA